MELKIESGVKPRPQKVVIYGCEGIGKTTLASRFPDPIIIDTEGGSTHMDVRRIVPQNWSELLHIVREVALQKVCKTIVLDTADWAEQSAITHICEVNKKSGIEEFGYGKGYTYVAEEMGKLLAEFDSCIACGINVVITAHAKMRKFEQPDEMGAYDRWELKLSKQSAPLIKEWADMVLFCNYKTFAVDDGNGHKKAKGGQRVIYTSHHPCWDAKNRHGLPEQIEMDYDKWLAPIFGGKNAEIANKSAEIATPEPSEHGKLVADVRKLMQAKDVPESELIWFLHKVKNKALEWDNIEAMDDHFLKGYVVRYMDKIVDGLRAEHEKLASK